MKYRYVVVEGPIGCGKTSLARLLAEHFNAELVLEDPGANPFLPQFYRDMRRYALATQIFFLFQRINQLTALRQPELFGTRTIADFMLEKDPIFAQITLDDNEYKLYTQLYNQLKPQAPAPDLVIYLQAPVESLVARVHRRGNSMEKNISEEYLIHLSEAYTRFFYDYRDSPLLIINSARLNFVGDPAHLELLVARILGMKGQREYFNVA